MYHLVYMQWYSRISLIITCIRIIASQQEWYLYTSREAVVCYQTQPACLSVPALKLCHDLNKSAISFSSVHNQMTCSPGKKELYFGFINLIPYKDEMKL